MPSKQSAVFSISEAHHKGAIVSQDKMRLCYPRKLLSLSYDRHRILIMCIRPFICKVRTWAFPLQKLICSVLNVCVLFVSSGSVCCLFSIRATCRTGVSVYQTKQQSAFTEFSEMMERGYKKTILLLSPDYVASHRCINEAQLALQQNFCEYTL